MRSGEPWVSQGQGCIGAASPMALPVEGLRGCVGVFWLLGTSAIAAPGEVSRLCFGMAV